MTLPLYPIGISIVDPGSDSTSTDSCYCLGTPQLGPTTTRFPRRFYSFGLPPPSHNFVHFPLPFTSRCTGSIPPARRSLVNTTDHRNHQHRATVFAAVVTSAESLRPSVCLSYHPTGTTPLVTRRPTSPDLLLGQSVTQQQL